MTAPYAIHFLQEGHFDAVWTIFTSVFPEKYGEEFVDAWIQRTPSISFGVFDIDTTLRGFVLTNQNNIKTQHIEFLGVDPTCQKGGIGTILLTRVLDTCLRRNLRITLVPIDDPRVINWYKKYGFVAIGQPFLSSYTGDLEQRMEYIPTHTPQLDPTLQIEIVEYQSLPRSFHQLPEIQPVVEYQEAQESLRLLTV
jgi:ribosomal protein S18 acetylase RimI-like enzyme